ncbi:3-oxoacyl-ACP synthase III family protein [Sulfurifustis variabilis]|nr:ketoacyl-ACP synthase III [Sulfurifustis variabilis]
MYMHSVGHSRIISTGMYLPPERLSSRELMEMFRSRERFGLPYEWLERTTGIRERRFAPPDFKSSEMAVAAAREALELGEVSPSQIDAIIYCGVLRDHVEPATAHVVQDKIGARNAIAFDVSNACLGFMNGMHLMDALIATGQARRGLVVTGERGNHYIRKALRVLAELPDNGDFSDLAAALTLGDAGAAAVMGPKLDPETGIKGFVVQSQGQHNGLCVCGDNGEDTHLVTKITEIVRETTRLVGPLYQALMHEHLGWQPSELSRYIPHQVGLRSVRKHAEVAQVPLEIIPITVDYLGNIISATIPVNISLLMKDKKLTNGERIYLSGTGSGISIAQAAMVWDAA